MTEEAKLREKARRKAYREANKEKIKEQKAASYQRNKEATLARSAEWQRNNKDKKNAINARYREGKSEQLYEYIKSYYEANPDKKAERKIRQKDWRQSNKGRVSANRRKRQAAKLQRTPEWLTEFDSLKIKCLYQVAAMRTRESGYAWHVDHVIPLQGETVSGLHVPDNLQVIPAIDNFKKNNSYVVT